MNDHAERSLSDRIDDVCDAFEQAWKSNKRPSIFTFLKGFDGPQRLKLLRELLLLDVDYRSRLGEEVNKADYETDLLEITPLFTEVMEEIFNRDKTVKRSTSDTQNSSGTFVISQQSRTERSAGRFEILKHHAAGGLGNVYVARDDELNREVALKEIKEKYAHDENSRSRFVVEAEITGRLEHPGIVPVYGMGKYDDGRPYYAMRFVKGESLQRAIHSYHKEKKGADNKTLELRKLLNQFVDVCNAIEYAHSRGVIHRDLKPSNVMLGKFGETLVVDWGLAKMVETKSEAQMPVKEETLRVARSGGSTAETQQGDVIDTVQYMSPEQAAGRIDELGPACDIFSLGAVLFCILTGKPPFSEAKSKVNEELLKVVRRGQFRRPREIDASVPKALEAICLKAMQTEKEARYESAKSLSDDVERYLADEPVEAHREPLLSRTARWGRMHKAIVSSISVAVTVVMIASLILTGVVSGKNKELATTNFKLDETNDQLTDTNTELLAANASERQAKDDAQEKQRKAESILGFFQDKVLAAARPQNQEGGLGVDTTIRAAVDAAEPQIAASFGDQPLVEASIRSTLGLTYDYLGEADLSIRQHQRARDLFASNLGPDHPNTLTSMNNLAVAYVEAGRLDQALPLYEQTLKLRRAKLGPEHPDTLISMDNLAVAYKAEGKLDKAIALHVETLKLMKAKLGPKHLDTLVSMGNLALAYKSAGRPEEALPLLEEKLKVMKVKLGPDHPNTLTSMVNLAGAYQAAGWLEEALPLFEETLKVMKVKLGPDHADTLVSMNNLAMAYKSAGKLDQALTLLEETLKLMKPKLDPEHPTTLTSMGNLAGAYVEAGRLDQALPLLEETLKLRKANLGPEHPDTLTSMNNLAAVYRSAGKLEEALPLLEETLKLRKANLGPQHSHTLISMGNLAVAYKAEGKLDKAIALHVETLKLMKAKLGPQHPNTLTSMNNLASAYYSADKLEQALPLFEETLKLQKAKLSPEHPATLASMNNLANVYESAGRLEEAIALHEETMKLLKVKLGPDHPNTLTSMNNLASAYYSADKLEQALPLFEETLKLQKAKLGPDHPNTLASMGNLASAYYSAGKLKEAIALHEETLKLRKAQLGPEHPDTLLSMDNLAGAYLGIKQPEKALPLFEQFIAGRRARAKADDLRFASLLMGVSIELLEHQQHSPAESYLRECLTIRGKVLPNQWLLFNTKAKLGAALAGQKKFDQAEPLLLEGYRGMKEREDKIPAAGKVRLTEALQRLVDLYTSWNKSDKAAEWQKKLDATKAKLWKQKKKSKSKKQTGRKKKNSDGNRDKPLIAPRPKLDTSKTKV